MRCDELNNKIKNAFGHGSKSLREKVINSCQSTPQLSADSEYEIFEKRDTGSRYSPIFRRIAAIAACIVLFVSGLSLGLFIPRGERDNGGVGVAETFVYLDVNPSVELRMDADERVVECIAANEDADEILAGLKLVGVDMNTALSAIVGSMYVNGYLSAESNSILVSVDGREDKEEQLLADITARINSVFEKSELECSIIAQTVKQSEELKARAEENGVSIGKMYLVEKMIESIEDFDIDDLPNLSGMSIKDLNLIYSTRPEKEENGDKQDDPFDKDVSTGNIGGLVKEDEALISLLETIERELSSIEQSEVRILPQFENGKLSMIYVVKIKFSDDELTYEYKIDCYTGELLSSTAVPSSDETDAPEHKDEENHKNNHNKK